MKWTRKQKMKNKFMIILICLFVASCTSTKTNQNKSSLPSTEFNILKTASCIIVPSMPLCINPK